MADLTREEIEEYREKHLLPRGVGNALNDLDHRICDMALKGATNTEGWKLVPLEPTIGMWDHGENQSMYFDSWAQKDEELRKRGCFDFPTLRVAALVHVYREMVKVAPTPEEHRKASERIEAEDDIEF